MKHLLEGNDKEIFAHLHDKQIQCFTFTSSNNDENNDSDKNVLLH